MPRKCIPLILLSFMALLSVEAFCEQEVIFEQGENYNLGNEVSTLLAIWAGDLEGDRVPEILAGGIVYGPGTSKGTLIMIRRNEASSFASIPSQSRTLVITVGNALEGREREIVVGSQGLYIYSRTGRLLMERSTPGDVTALQVGNFRETELDEIIYGTSGGDVVYLTGFEPEYQFSMGETIEFIFHREQDTFYVVTSRSIDCRKADGEELWSHPVKGEIRSAVTYDVNNDGKKEIIYISGSDIYTLSFDGQKENLILSPPALPLTLLVEDLSADGKPDLVIFTNNDRVIVYSNLKDEVQSFYVKREADETPILFSADVIRDGKVDLIYGGATQVLVFKNVVPSGELITRGQLLLSEGEELFQQREYERALAKFEEAEKVFILAGKEDLAAQCQQYILEVTETTESLSRAESALSEGEQLYSEGEYEEARAQFETAHTEYAQLTETDSYYDQYQKEASDGIEKCDLAVADQYFAEGERLEGEMQYTEAKDSFLKAKAIYSRLGNDKENVCSERIAEIDRILEEQLKKEQINLLLIPAAVFLVALIVLAALLATRKKVSAKLEKGHVYLLMESQPKKSIQLIKEYGRLGYEGLVITRLSPEQVQKKLKKQKILQLSSGAKEDSIPPDNVVNILLRMKEFMTNRKESILLLDGLDYIAIQNTFDDALSLIRKLAESVTLYRGILLVSLNPKSLEEKEIMLLGEEMEPLEF